MESKVLYSNPSCGVTAGVVVVVVVVVVSVPDPSSSTKCAALASGGFVRVDGVCFAREKCFDCAVSQYSPVSGL